MLRDMLCCDTGVPEFQEDRKWLLDGADEEEMCLQLAFADPAPLIGLTLRGRW